MPDAAAIVARWREHPREFVRDNFQININDTVHGLQVWQGKALDALRGPGVHRIALPACAGPGKTALLAWTDWWLMATQADAKLFPKGNALSISEDNLRTALWPELRKWRDMSPFLTREFDINSDFIYQKEFQGRWFIQARAFAKKASVEEMGEVISGGHEKYFIVELDEAGSMHPVMLQRAEQAMATIPADGYGLILLAGNCTSKQGALYAATKNPKFTVIKITGDPDDPERSPRVDIEWARQMIANTPNGRENNWVKSHVLGIFPDQEFQGLIGEDEVEAAMRRSAPPMNMLTWERRLGVDVARFGDDRTVLFGRQGNQAYYPVVMRHSDGPAVARQIEMSITRWCQDAAEPVIFVDDTGGYGSSVVDSLRVDRYEPVPVNVSSQADDPEHYFNRRAELYWRAAEWVKRGGCLPQIEGLAEEAAATTYTIQSGRLQLEPKNMVKARIGRSPDLWDAFCLTFAQAERYLRKQVSEPTVDFTSAAQTYSKQGQSPGAAVPGIY